MREEDIPICIRLLQMLSDNFGKDTPEERRKSCLGLTGSRSGYVKALNAMKEEGVIDVVIVVNMRTGEGITYPVLKEKQHKRVLSLGAKNVFCEPKN